MSLGRYLRLAVIVFVGSLLTLVEGLAQAKPEPMPEALFLPSAHQLSPLDTAYLDAFIILGRDNICSRFYGGSRVIQVLNELKKHLKATNIDTSIAARMSGPTMSVTDLKYGLSYRLFDKAELNLRGSFYRGNTSRHVETVPAIGNFAPNTREARVTILLHEMGHLIWTPNKQWLLPDDGNSAFLSRENTQRVIAVCHNQITQLDHLTFEQELLIARGDNLRPSATTEPSGQ